MAARAYTSAVALALAVSDVSALQMSRSEAPDTTNEMKLIMLDDQEVASRGSRCLDGSTPGFYYKQGTEEDKWLLWFQGGGLCMSEADCAASLPLHDLADSISSFPLQEYSEFSNYHHVYFASCDLGLYLGDRSDPVVYNGKTLYFQGARMVKHVIDVLQSNNTLGSATEVLIAGGSGGGQASYVMADYIKGMLPASVKKFGAAPMNGWYVEGGIEELKEIFTVANMGSAISQNCAGAFSEADRYHCMDPANAYRFSTSNMFMTQMFDYTFSWNNTDDLKSAYYSCLSDEDPSSSQCDNDDVSLLQEYLSNFTTTLQTYPKYTENGQGGYISTCTKHTFYNEDELFNSYANNGVTVGDAISKWWKSLGTNSAATWYLPCSLGTATKTQCESTCS